MPDQQQLVSPTQLTAYADGDPLVLLDQAVALVRTYCGWRLGPSVEETLTVDGSGSQFLDLPSMHVTEVSEVVENGTVLDASAYQWSERGQLWRATGWTGAFRGVQVTLTHGYDVLPAELTAVISGIVTRAQASPDGAVRVQTGARSVTYSQTAFNVAGGVSLVEHEKWVLDRYKLPPRP